MKKFMILLVLPLLLSGCSKLQTKISDATLIVDENENYECDYKVLYEDDDTLVRSFCMAEIYVNDDKGKKITLKDALNRKLIDIEDVMDGLKVMETFDNGDEELQKMLDNSYKVLKCKETKTTDEKNKKKIVITRVSYDEFICYY